MKIIIKTIIILLIIVFGITSIAMFISNMPTDNIPKTGVEFEIKKGDNVHIIANRLWKNGFIRSKLLFIGIIKIIGQESRIKSGWILLDSDSSTSKIIKTIVTGKYIDVSFTIPEGSTLSQIKEILIKDKIVTEEDLNKFFADTKYKSKIGLSKYKSIEGFLFPDTYKFHKGIDVDKIFEGMVNLFFQKLIDIYPSYKSLSEKELYEKVIMASIIEKEVKNSEESPIVASVFYNRIKMKMKLQSCATIQYILGKPKEHLLESDVLIDNPYNTYLYQGLPPGPICSPGENALKAAFSPSETEYLFFVVKDLEKGTHQFSKTYEEHLKAQSVYKARKGFY